MQSEVHIGQVILNLGCFSINLKLESQFRARGCFELFKLENIIVLG